MLTIPAALFGVFLSTLYGALFHFWRGGGMKRLFLYLILAWAGFWAGHFFAIWMEWSFGMVGTLSVGAATIGSVLFLALGYWLSHFEWPGGG